MQLTWNRITMLKFPVAHLATLISFICFFSSPSLSICLFFFLQRFLEIIVYLPHRCTHREALTHCYRDTHTHSFYSDITMALVQFHFLLFMLNDYGINNLYRHTLCMSRADKIFRICLYESFVTLWVVYCIVSAESLYVRMSWNNEMWLIFQYVTKS